MRYFIKQYILIVFVAISISGCFGIDLHEITSSSEREPESPAKGRDFAQGLYFYQLRYAGQLNLAKEYTGKGVSAFGSNGKKTFLYFGLNDELNKVFAYDLNKASLSVLPTKVAGKKHKKEGFYNASSEYKKTTKNPADETKLVNIIAGPDDKALISLTGLKHRRGGIYGTAANGGVLEIDKNEIKGVWGNIIDSLNSADAKEISALAHLNDHWIAFSDDLNAVGANRKWTDEIDEAEEGPTGINGDPFKTIFTAALGHGTDLFLADKTGVFLRRAPDIERVCEIDLGPGAENVLNIAKASDLKIFPNSGDVIHVSNLAMVGTKLFVGLKALSPSGGGLAIVDFSSEQPKVEKPLETQKGLSITQIAPSQDGESALISTDGTGMLFFAENRFYHLNEQNLGKLTAENASKTIQVVFEDMEKAVEAGFNIGRASVGAINIGNKWYIATSDNGIFIFEISREFK